MKIVLQIADRLDHTFREINETNSEEEGYHDLIAQSPECSYLNIRSDDIQERWETFYHVRSDAFGLFG